MYSTVVSVVNAVLQRRGDKGQRRDREGAEKGHPPMRKIYTILKICILPQVGKQWVWINVPFVMQETTHKNS